MISSMISRKASTGKVSGLGWPGAKEMIPGFSMSALIRRMAEKRMPRAALEKRSSQAVAVVSVISTPSSGRSPAAQTPQYIRPRGATARVPGTGRANAGLCRVS